MTNQSYNPAGGTTYNLGTSISSTDTTILLSSFLEPVTGTPYTMDLLNTQIVYATISPKTTQSEFISFTGITQNADGTATLTGVVRGLAKKYPFTTDSAYQLPHSGQSQFIMSDAPQVFQEYVSLNNDETVGGVKIFTENPQTPATATNPDDIPNLAQVESIATGGASINAMIVTGTAGEAVIIGQVVYLKISDQKWYKADSSDTTKSVAVKLGITQTTGSGTIAVLIGGLDQTQSGLVAGTVYYLSTGGAVSSTVGTNERLIGRSISTTQILFEDDEQSRFVSLTDGSRTYTADTGSADVYVMTLIPAILAYKAGQVFSFKAANANLTTTPTLNVNGLGAKTIVKNSGIVALVAGDIAVGQIVVVEYDGTNFQMSSQTGNIPAVAKFGGTGADGALTITSGVTQVDVGGAQFFVKNYTSISITGTGALQFINPHANGTIVTIRSQGNITLTSSTAPMINCSGMGGAGGTGGAGAVSGTATAGNAGNNGTNIFDDLTTHPGQGGPAAVSSSSAGSTSVAGVALSNVFGYTQTVYELSRRSVVVACGSGGGGAGGGSGGSTSASHPTGSNGGNGGGGLIIECGGAWNFTTALGISCAGLNGVAGVAGTDAVNTDGVSGGSGGGGGSGGFAVVLYNSLTANTGTINTAGGAGGTGGGSSKTHGTSGTNQSTSGSAGAGAGSDGGAGGAGASGKSPQSDGNTGSAAVGQRGGGGGGSGGATASNSGVSQNGGAGGTAGTSVNVLIAKNIWFV